MRSLVALGLICMLLPKADALTCYHCLVSCDTYAKTECPVGMDYCLTGTATVLKHSTTKKSCANKEMCDVSQSSLMQSVTDVKCCQSDLCNGAESFTLSFLLMFIPLLSSVIF